jgi:hypothetical protein
MGLPAASFESAFHSEEALTCCGACARPSILDLRAPGISQFCECRLRNANNAGELSGPLIGGFNVHASPSTLVPVIPGTMQTDTLTPRALPGNLSPKFLPRIFRFTQAVQLFKISLLLGLMLCAPCIGLARLLDGVFKRGPRNT